MIVLSVYTRYYSLIEFTKRGTFNVTYTQNFSRLYRANSNVAAASEKYFFCSGWAGQAFTLFPDDELCARARIWRALRSFHTKS